MYVFKCRVCKGTGRNIIGKDGKHILSMQCWNCIGTGEYRVDGRFWTLFDKVEE